MKLSLQDLLGTVDLGIFDFILQEVRSIPNRGFETSRVQNGFKGRTIGGERVERTNRITVTTLSTHTTRDLKGQLGRGKPDASR